MAAAKKSKDNSKRVAELRRLIWYHRRLYYVENQPQITDADYDRLERELLDLEKAHPELITPDSPTQRVGDEVSGEFPTVPHEVPMLSLDNARDDAELANFDRRVRELLEGEAFSYMAELKIDGTAVSLHFERGRFVRGLTRGNGREGEDVTANLRTLNELPGDLNAAAERAVAVAAFLEVRGEVYLSRAEFARINAEREEAGHETYANPRNTAAGTLKLKTPAAVARRRLQLFIHGVGKEEGARFRTHGDVLDTCRRLGLPTQDSSRRCGDIDAVRAFIAEWDTKRHALPYDTDGIVIKVDRLDQQDRCGQTSKAPRWAIAYKFKTEQAETVLRRVDSHVGKTGVITPVARFDPVLLAQTTVKNASLHNWEEIARKDIRVGDTVIVEKAGEIIPQVVGVVAAKRPPRTRKIRPPAVCPVCGAEAVQLDGEVALRCSNARCGGRVEAQIIHFASRGCLDIEHLGEALVRQLLAAGLLSDAADIFDTLPHKPEEIQALERMGERSTENLLQAIEAATDRDLWRLLCALNIPHVGTSAARLLEREFSPLDALANAEPERLEAIDGVGPIMARAIHEYFADADNAKRVKRLAAAGVNLKSKQAKRPSHPAFAGKTFVITGTLARHKRSEIQQLIVDLGGKASGSVSKKTDFLIAGENAGGKLAKAKKLGVKVLSEAEFEAILER